MASKRLNGVLLELAFYVLTTSYSIILHGTSSLVQIIFSFWSFEITEGILRNQKFIIGLDSFSKQSFIHLAPF